MKLGAHHVLMEGEPGAAGGAAGAPAAAPAAPGAGAAPAQPPAAPGGSAGAGEGGDPGGSALGAAGAPAWSLTAVPEKYRVTGEDGEIDVLATFAKVDAHRTQLEKRLGTGDIRPKTADEYKLPDTDAFKGLQLDEGQAKAFREKAHSWGLNQAQYAAVMTEWATLAPALVEAGQKQSAEDTLTQLRGVWQGPDFDANMRGAHAAVSSVAEKAGLSFQEVEQAIGNNPVAIRLFAALSKEMGEDRTPSAAGGAGGQTDINTLMTHPAYMDARHPEHKAISEQVRKHFERVAARPT